MEEIMARVKDIKINGYCDEVHSELISMKASIHVLQENAKKTYGENNERAMTYVRHLCELADMIDWKLQLLMKACPFDWKGDESDIESTVSVGPSEIAPGPDFSGGYVGG
jgi:hypothetical protein